MKLQDLIFPMKSLDLIIRDKDLSMRILADMPVDATDFHIRFNGKIRYICYDKDQNQSNKFKKPHEYALTNLNDPMSYAWIHLDICKPWSEFVVDNNVCDASLFKFLVYKTYPVELFGESDAWGILNRMPEDASHYNYLSKTYQKYGEHGASLATDGWNADGSIDWYESYHSNEFVKENLIELTALYIQMNKLKGAHRISYM